MNKLITLFVLWTCLCGFTFPARDGYVTDQAGILSADQEQALEQELGAYDRRTHVVLAVVTVRSLEGGTVEGYATALFNDTDYRIGHPEDNTGVLILVAPTEHRMRIVRGDGLRERLPQNVTDDIVQGVMVPQFRAHNPSQAILRGVHAVESALDPQVPAPAVSSSRRNMAFRAEDDTPWGKIVMYGLLVCFGILALRVLWGVMEPGIRRREMRKVKRAEKKALQEKIDELRKGVEVYPGPTSDDEATRLAWRRAQKQRLSQAEAVLLDAKYDIPWDAENAILAAERLISDVAHENKSKAQEKASAEAAAKKREEEFSHQQTLVAPALAAARNGLNDARAQLTKHVDGGYAVKVDEELAVASTTFASAETESGNIRTPSQPVEVEAANYREAPKMLPDLYKDPGKIISLANTAKDQAQTAVTACRARIAGCEQVVRECEALERQVSSLEGSQTEAKSALGILERHFHKDIWAGLANAIGGYPTAKDRVLAQLKATKAKADKKVLDLDAAKRGLSEAEVSVATVRDELNAPVKILAEARAAEENLKTLPTRAEVAFFRAQSSLSNRHASHRAREYASAAEKQLAKAKAFVAAPGKIHVIEAVRLFEGVIGTAEQAVTQVRRDEAAYHAEVERMARLKREAEERVIREAAEAEDRQRRAEADRKRREQEERRRRDDDDRQSSSSSWSSSSSSDSGSFGGGSSDGGGSSGSW